MEIVRKLLPYLLVLFFLIRANKNPFYLLGIPFLMFMSNSVFFETARIFNIPMRYQVQLGFFWLIPLWIFSRTVSRNQQKKTVKYNFGIIDILVLVLASITLIDGITTVNEYYPHLKDVPLSLITLMSLFISYFILKDWFSINDPKVVYEFLYTIVVINTIASFLFILHQGLHLSIYVGQEYMTESFQGKEITRSFWFMPTFLFFSVAFLLVFTKKHSIISLSLLGLNLIAIVITYTISSVAIAAIIFLCYFILKGLKVGKLGPVFKNIFLYSFVAVAGFFLLSKLLPANVNYLLSRISEHTESHYTDKEPNDMDVRLINTLAVIAEMDADKRLLGMGPTTQFQQPKVEEMKKNTADTVWSGAILHWGFVGLALFVLMYVVSGLQAFNLFLTSDGIISDFALLLVLYTISQFIEGFVSWTFLSGNGLTIGLWYFALLSTIAGFRKNELQKKLRYAYN